MASRVSAEFKHEVVQVALTSGLSRRKIASDFDIGFSTLGRWIKEERDQVFDPGPQGDLIKENERLGKENKLLREEREVLKKATIFEYINGFYNPRRKHSALGWKSPLAFEKEAA